MALANLSARTPSPADVPAQLEVTGHSMRFFLRPGDAVRLARVPVQRLRWGDLVVVLDDRRLVVHRLLWRSGGRLRTKGDALLRLDPAVPAAGIVGRVCAVRRRDGRWIDMDGKAARLASCLWGLFSTVWFALGLPGDEWLADKAKQLREAGRRAAAALHGAYHGARWLLSACALLAFETARGLARVFARAAFRTRDFVVEQAALWAHRAKHAALRSFHASVRCRRRAWRASIGALERAAAIAGPVAGAASAALPPLRRPLLVISRACDAASFPVERRLRGVLPRRIRWAGAVTLIGDVIIPRNCLLEIEPGTLVNAERAGDSLGLSRQAFGRRLLATAPGKAHLVLFGSATARGAASAPVAFGGPAFGGVVLLGRGRLDAARTRFSAPVLALDRTSVTLRRCELPAGAAAGASALMRLRSCAVSGAERALSVHDDAALRVSDCAVRSSRWGLVLEGDAHGTWRGGECSSCADAGAAVSGRARLAAAGGRWSGHRRAFSLDGRSRLSLRRCRLEGNATGLEALGRARAVLERCVVAGGEHGVWAQNDASVLCRDGAWEAADVGARASHDARLDVRGGAFRGCRKTALFVEERARVRALGASFTGNENGALALQDSRLTLLRCAVEGTRDTGVWGDYRSCLDVGRSAYCGNFKDLHREYRPTYG